VDGLFEGKNENVDPVSSYKQRYGVEQNAEVVFFVNFMSAS
jgi:hypothetical protein